LDDVVFTQFGGVTALTGSLTAALTFPEPAPAPPAAAVAVVVLLVRAAAVLLTTRALLIAAPIRLATIGVFVGLALLGFAVLLVSRWLVPAVLFGPVVLVRWTIEER
jgi:hypothetical protein